jgi:hypothetical protein
MEPIAAWLSPLLFVHRTEGPAAASATRRALVLAAAAVLAVKLIWFAADRGPLFYMGDSRAYLNSAMGYGTLTDRSNTYGRLLWLFAVVPRSLTPLILAQTLAGAVTAWLLAVLLLRYFRVRPVIAILAAAVMAAEPLQILYERMVLTESFAALLLVGYFTLNLSYLDRPRLAMLIAIAAMGVLLVSLRLVYIPVTLFNAVLTPALGLAGPGRPWHAPNGAKQFVTHLSVSVLATLAFHQGYQIALGRAARLPPAYQYASGFFLAANWAPLIEPEDATDPRAKQVVAELLMRGRYPLRDADARSDQLWAPGGLKSELIKAFGGDHYSANRAARAMSMRTFRRVPLSVIRVAVLSYAAGWRGPAATRQRLLVDQGTTPELDAGFIGTLHDRFRLDGRGIPAAMPASKRYHLIGVPWDLTLCLSPLIGLLAVGASRREERRGALMLLVTGGLLLAVPCFVLPNAGLFRSVHPLVGGTLAGLAVIANRLLDHRVGGSSVQPG